MPYPSTYETERLLLRLVDVGDAAFILELLNTPKWIQNIGDRKVHSIEEAKQYIEERMLPGHEALGFGNFVVIRKSDGVKMGTCGLYNREGLDGLDIGFAFLPAYERHGYAYESALKMKELALNLFGVKTILAITTKTNLASQRLLEKIGLEFQKYTRIPNDAEELMLYQYQKQEEHDE